MAAALGIVGPLLVTGQLATGPQGGPADPAGLSPFASCGALRDWYVDHTIGQVGAYGWSGGVIFGAMERVPLAATDSAATPAAGTADTGVANGATGTNTQEAGVDEPDVAKTDGRIVVRLQDRGQRQEVVVTDVTGPTPRELSTWTLPEDAHADGLLLVGDHVLLSGGHGRTFVVDSMRSPYGYGGSTATDLFDLDVSEPTAIRLVAHTTWSGSALTLRQYGDTVRLVTSTGLPALPFVMPGKGISAAQATVRNREVVRTSTIEQWLPTVRLEGGTSHRAVDCSRIYHPAAVSGPDRDTATLGVFTLHPGVADPVSAVAVTGRGSDVYSSGDRLYVWETSWTAPHRLGVLGRTLVRPIARPLTSVHAFAFDGDETRYVGSGQVDGQVRDRWSLDEHDGHLRMALTWPRRLLQLPQDPLTPDDSTSPGSTAGDNGVVVLDERGDRLVEVGRLRGLGPDEQVQSVRWFDDLAVLVTFRQTDPLFTVDLSDPSRPRALGALELPGFSSYLHPLGHGLLLGLGSSGTEGTPGGGEKAAVFDISDPTRARQLDEVGLGSGWLTAGQDPHAFTWLGTADGAGTAITQLEQTSGADDGGTLVALDVDRDGRLSTRTLPSAGGWQQRALPLPDGRIALVGDRVVVVATGR